MRTAIFGGSFNPPHIGHVEAASAALAMLSADRLFIIPCFTPPHKEQAGGSPSAEKRFELTSLAFSRLHNTEVLDIELVRGGKSYTVDTLEELKTRWPDDELFLLMGTDMLECFESWRNFRRIFQLVTLAVFPREEGKCARISEMAEKLKGEYGARIEVLNFTPVEISSTQLRELLRNRQGTEYFPEDVYGEIIRQRLYDARPEFKWLRDRAYACLDERRIPHVMGCEQEAVKLARRWGADPDLAAEAGILHDITKKLKGPEQLKLCQDYDIITDDDERSNYKLLHSKTGAEFSRRHFGVCDEVYNAILWHTTGKPDMSLLEKIIYMADYIEPNRSFEGVEELRTLAYENLDKAVALGLQMGIEDLQRRGTTPHVNSIKALEFLQN